MGARAKVNELLQQAGAVLKRTRKHEVWSLPNGKNFVRGKTPSDQRSDDNNLSDLKHALQVVKPVAVEGERKPKRIKRGAAPAKTQYKRAETLSLAQSLRMAGLTDDALRDRMSAQETRMGQLEQRLSDAEAHIENCWACRLSGWLKSKVNHL